MSLSRAKVFSSDTEDSSNDDEWNAKASSKKQKKIKKSRTDVRKSKPQEDGEISSDGLEDEDDDGLDDNLIGGEEDKARLEKMTEREREEELYRRAERRDAMLARRAVKKRLKEKKRENQKAQISSKSPKKSRFSRVFSSDSDVDNQLFDNSQKLPDRKFTMTKQKEERNNKLKELMQQRNRQQQRRLHESSESEGEKKKQKKHRSDVRQVYSSSESDASGNEVTKKKAADLSSLSRSSSSASSDEDSARGRSRSPVEELVTNVQQLSKIRLSRFKLENWIHMPFFNTLVTGCFVKIHIGINQGVPVYRCAEIADVVEGHKVYDLGNTRTNKCLILKASKQCSSFRIAFVSNQDFTQSEFDKWMRKTTDDGMKTPSLSFVERKWKEIEKMKSAAITDDKVVDQIIQSKKRFMKGPTNYAMRKAELIKVRGVAELDSDMATIRKIDEELADIDNQVESIERRRTTGFRSIMNINQRNRLESVKQAEDALKREAEEAANAKEDDPYTRIQSRPVIWTKRNFESFKNKNKDQNENGPGGNEPGNEDKIQSPKKTAMNSVKLTKAPASLHDIHDFDIDITVDFDAPLKEDSKTAAILLESNSGRSVSKPNNTNEPTSRKFMNLEEYKKTRGLI
ncbi:RNA polymerase-associated protein rtf1 [Cichlidogyrus casuarinus]|uniref:RNA polymerase-associated protein rtf1 n=1 Tax=Cichlidogyrus casuarinus TaxID=1844966 RepID=A0ABD2QEN2_9PLAT